MTLGRMITLIPFIAWTTTRGALSASVKKVLLDSIRNKAPSKYAITAVSQVVHATSAASRRRWETFRYAGT